MRPVTPWNSILLRKPLVSRAVKFTEYFKTRKVTSVITRSRNWPLISSHMNPLHTQQFHFYHTYFNMIFASMSRSPKWPISFRFSYQTLVRDALLYHVCHMPPKFPSPLFNHTNNIWWGARGGVVVTALRYKQAGRGFDSRWCHWNFSVT
jgi:hypothetical protein